MSLIDNFNEKPNHADPVMVDFIIQAVGKALSSVTVPHVTTQADMLSAMFTILHRMLKAIQEMEDPADSEAVKLHNRQEIGTILTNMLLEFGTPSGRVQ